MDSVMIHRDFPNGENDNLRHVFCLLEQLTNIYQLQIMSIPLCVPHGTYHKFKCLRTRNSSSSFGQSMALAHVHDIIRGFCIRKERNISC